ncbi:MAG TPA: isopentenyl-diphosphate Delta-isomerase [Steroidobacteraceae bacterium]|nr:isopentenyl-diphosphate Delta-isomerase [Steroidobacteraceae bacterium]
MDEGRVDMGAEGADSLADADTLILVDEADREIGHMSKARCHDGRGILHRAFSLLVFNAAGELLLQQRSAAKRLWPLYWSNSCCSHPRRAESMDTAIHRRLHEELGVRCPLQFLFKFQYQAQWDANAAENELCSVYIGRTRGPIEPDRDEVAGLRWVSPEQLQEEMVRRRPGQFTPWFVMEWERIWSDHRPAVLATRS